MQSEYHTWWSPSLGQEMALKVYGYYGKPMLVFPAQEGRFYEFEDTGMLAAVSAFVESGRIKVYSVDSIDSQSWANWEVHPADRARRHQDYDRYITAEVFPFIRQHCGGKHQPAVVTGVSLGAYHAANAFFRHPELFDTLIALSGMYHLAHFVGDYMDDNIYFNSPLLYLRNMSDPWYLERYRASRIIVCAGQGAWDEEMLADTLALKQVLTEKGIPHWIDIWGADVVHDWPWWRRMLPYFLGRLDLPAYTP